MNDDSLRAPEREDEKRQRAQTDASLRTERARSDTSSHARVAALEATADQVIAKARARADELLARARRATDHQFTDSNAHSLERTRKSRHAEDAVVNAERADADETVRNERAERVALLTTERDETDKDLLSERLRSDDAVATRDEFLGVVSHDLRNILGSMVGFASLIASSMAQGQPNDVIEHAQRIQRSGARMNRLIGDLLDIASIEAGALAVTRELTDPTRVLVEAVDSFQTQAASSVVTLIADTTGPSSPISMDPARILQVLTNLLSNAIKFTPSGGKIVARVTHTAAGALFTVSDTGMGIPADKLERIFDRFEQIDESDRRGTGLGLYISKCIVLGHDGRIWAESTLGAGSKFSFVI